MKKRLLGNGLILFLLICIGSSESAFGQGSPNIIWKQKAIVDRINSVIFTPDGQTLISGGSDRLINFWRVSDGALLQTLNTNAPFVHESAIEWLSITPDGKLLASCSYEYIQLWDLPSGNERKLYGHTDWVVAVAFSADGKWLASASFDTTVKIWNPLDGSLITTLPGSAQQRCVAFSPNGKFLAAASGANIIKIYDTSDWSLVTTLYGHSDDLFSCVFSPDGTMLASGGYDDTARIWNVADWSLKHTFSGNGGNVYNTAFSPDGTRLALTDGEGHTIKVYRTSDGGLLQTFTEEVNDVQTLAFSPTGLLGYGRIDSTVVLASLNGASAPRITSPVSGSTFNSPASISISAVPSKSDGSVVKMEFFQNGIRLGQDLTSPFSYSWENVIAGTYSLTVLETDASGGTGSSAPITITVINPTETNAPPVITVTSPKNGATFAANGDIQLSANATASAGISRVEFFHDGINIGQVLNAPFSLRWTSVPAGTYSIYAVVTDAGGAQTTSSPVLITVTEAPPESVKPRVTIRSPRSGARVTTDSIVMSGTARDNVGVGAVWYSLNGGFFTTASGTENWETTLALMPGENVVQVKSVDVNGNESALVSRKFFYLVAHTISLQVEGSGSIRPLRDGQILDVGKTYSIKANPRRDFVFDRWSGSIETNVPAFSFVMSPSMTLTAHFVPNPFAESKGTYYGLIQPASPHHERTGFVQIKTTASGAFSGKITLGGKTYPMRGKFNGDGSFSGSNPQTGMTLTLQLHFSDGTDQITGSISDGTTTAVLIADRAVNSRSNPSPNAGQYTVLIPSNPKALEETPQGNGFGVLKVDATGKTRLSGSLADGTPFTQSAVVSKDGRLPFYAPLYRGMGSISGELQFRDQPQTSDLDGAVNWFRPAGGTMFPAGFATHNILVGSHYSKSSGTPVLSVIEGDENVLVALGGGDLESELQKRVTLKPNNRFEIPQPEDHRLRLSVSSSSGALKGTFVHPITGRSTSSRGVVFQKQNLATGYFLGTAQSGFVTVLPADESRTIQDFAEPEVDSNSSLPDSTEAEVKKKPRGKSWNDD